MPISKWNIGEVKIIYITHSLQKMCDTQLFIYILNGLLREHSVNHAATYKEAGLQAVPL